MKNILTLIFLVIEGVFMTIILLKYAKQDPVKKSNSKSPVQISIAAILGFITLITAISYILSLLNIYTAVSHVDLATLFFVYLSLTAYSYEFTRSNTKRWTKLFKVFAIAVLIFTYYGSVIGRHDWFIFAILFWAILCKMYLKCKDDIEAEPVRYFDQRKKKNDNNPNNENVKEKKDKEIVNNKLEYCPYCGRLIDKYTGRCEHCGKG